MQEILNTTINVGKYNYKCKEQVDVHITYEMDVPINQNTIIKDETIKYLIQMELMQRYYQ